MNMTKGRTRQTYQHSFRCYFPSKFGTNYTTHFQRMPLSDMPKWIKAYQFTHPECLSICVKIWLTDREETAEENEEQEGGENYGNFYA